MRTSLREGMMLDKLIDRIGDVQGRATVRTVFGDPMEVHGRTIIPVAKVRFGFGMGMGRDKRKDDENHDDDHHRTAGGGGGGGAVIRPLAVIEISDGQTKVTPIVDVTRIVLAAIALAACGIFWVSRTLRAQAGLGRIHAGR
jgi:uncharacterized spore protein YtfJ